jgi:hypothetical protein
MLVMVGIIEGTSPLRRSRNCARNAGSLALRIYTFLRATRETVLTSINEEVR